MNLSLAELLAAWNPEKKMLRGMICSKIERLFDAEEFKIGNDFNTTFVVNVYDFSTPVTLVVSLKHSANIVRTICYSIT